MISYALCIVSLACGTDIFQILCTWKTQITAVFSSKGRHVAWPNVVLWKLCVYIYWYICKIERQTHKDGDMPERQCTVHNWSVEWSFCSPINATQTSSCYICRSCSSTACEHSTSHCLSAIRSVDIKLFGAPARLHFRGTATLLIKALRRVQALSPSASWYCLLKPKEPNNNKHLCCYRLSLSD